MRKPNQSLDDYNIRPDPEVTAEPPRSVLLQRTGEIEVLQPLTRAEVRTKRGRYTFRAPYQPLWFRRFLAVGSGALVMIAFVLVSAILVGINDPTAGPEVATIGNADEVLAQPEEPYSFDVSTPSTFASTSRDANIVRSITRRRTARSVVRLVHINKPKRQFRPPPQAEEPKFVPTTLVIYAENGVINTRIEPWIHTSSN